MTDLTAETAQAEIDATLGDRDHAYWQQNGSAHDRAVERMRELQGAIHGDQPALFEDPNMSNELADLMGDAMLPVDDPAQFSFEAYQLPEGDEWDDENEAVFREIFFRADLSQPEVDQMLTIASSPAPELKDTMAVLTARYDGDEEAFIADLVAAKTVLNDVGGQPLIDFLNRSGHGNSIQVFDLALRKARQRGHA